ncbi:MAG: glycogen debranching protein GlgX, partial [Acetobacteraceae bacterium]|nr:glycogen debranching protein GlgX [Acetobacteraceae bacterium]
SPAVIEYLTHLGVNSIELLPVQNFVDDRHLVQKGLRNYWGYSPISFFAPVPRYCSRPDLGEFKTMISRLHDAGIEVFLDVVYNHTAEGSELGPTLSFRGIDNKSYYRLSGDQRYYVDTTGCGNALNLSHPSVLKMVTDSLRYWVNEMHVDGFRFDLATTLARANDNQFSAQSNFLASLEQDPVLSRVKIIAEPWDLGHDGYHLGDFPAGWSEWNDRFRDCARRFWRGDGSIPEMATRLTGSSDVFDRRGRRPRSSVNFVTAHDGFTLNDLVSYDYKHNEANLDENRDGTDDNYSWNCGVEGLTGDPAVVSLRERQKRNFFATLLLSQGLPMILAGDELGRTQLGNNNAYCQDNEISWVDWEIDEYNRLLIDFVRKLIVMRNAFPILRRNRFLSGEYNPDLDVRDVRWLTPAATDMGDEQWNDPNARCFGMLLDGRAQASGIKRPSMDATALLVLNAHHDVVRFQIPEVVGGSRWRRLIDTNVPEGQGRLGVRSGEEYEVTGRSVLLLALEPDEKPSVALRHARQALAQVIETPTQVPEPQAEPEPEPEAEPEPVEAPDA